MISERSRGYVLGAVAAASYGSIRSFALPSTRRAWSRIRSFLPLCAGCGDAGALMLFRRQSFALARRDILPLAAMGLLFSVSSLLLFQSYNLMDAGIASTILFVYPVMVAVIMAVGFHERITAATVSRSSWPAGHRPAFLQRGETVRRSASRACCWSSSRRSPMRSTSSASTVRRSKPSDRETYLLQPPCSGSLVYVVRLRGGADLQAVPSPLMWINAVSLALFPTIVSLVTMAGAILRIGSTPTAILGALEPVTALSSASWSSASASRCVSVSAWR